MEVRLERPVVRDVSDHEPAVTGRDVYRDQRVIGGVAPMTTDVFWIPMLQDGARRNSLSRRDTWTATTTSKVFGAVLMPLSS